MFASSGSPWPLIGWSSGRRNKVKKHKDILDVLRHKNLRVTPARRMLLQFILDHRSRRISLREIHEFAQEALQGVDRSSIYRNIELFKRIEVIQELDLPDLGKHFQFIFDPRVHHYYICKACGRLNRSSAEVLKRVEAAFKGIHAFTETNLSVVFYGRCAGCMN